MNVFLTLGSAQLSEEDQEILVEQHNLRRGQVEPSAANMQKMRWDKTLKVLAEGYAAKCVWDHNPDLEDVGENLYITTGPLDPSEAVEKWFKEHENYTYTSNECKEGEMCGHYTQVVWADSERVGCAAHLCEEVEGLPFEKSTILVCNYFPTGNYVGTKPYEEGESCSRCPENFPNCEGSLCVAEDWKASDAPLPSGPSGTIAPLPPDSSPDEGSSPPHHLTTSNAPAAAQPEPKGSAGPPAEVAPESPSAERGWQREGEGEVDLDEVIKGRLSGQEDILLVDVRLQGHSPTNTLAPQEREDPGRGRAFHKNNRILVTVSSTARHGPGSGSLFLIGVLAYLLA